MAFEESIGQDIHFTTHSLVKISGKKKPFQTRSFTANLISVSKEELKLKYSNSDFFIPLSEVKSAKLIFKNTNKNKKRGV